jgi:glycosyltransferase involved in cell wall biosynthesis
MNLLDLVDFLVRNCDRECRLAKENCPTPSALRHPQGTQPVTSERKLSLARLPRGTISLPLGLMVPLPSMSQIAPRLSTAPQFSVIIAVFNDWAILNGCLQSLAAQENAPTFEVIVVDDGSTEPTPEFIQEWTRSYPLTVVTESHGGIPAARNRGVQASSASVLLFVDADSRPEPDCLAALNCAVVDSAHDYFQLHLVGDTTNLLGRAEELRLITFLNHVLQSDGHIRYVNTAGFAIRRSRVDVQKGLFDPRLPRGEDTLLLARLIQQGELPFFVANAKVQHVVPFSIWRSIRKDFRSAYLERTSYSLIASMGVHIRVKNRDRLSMLREMWKVSESPQIGRSAWIAVVVRQSVQRVFSFFWSLPGLRPTFLSR